MGMKPCGRSYQSLPLLEEPCPCWWSWRKVSIRWLFRESACEGVWKRGGVQEKDECRNGCDPGKWLGLACMFCFSKVFKWMTYLLFVYHRDITRPRTNSRSLPLPTKTLSSVCPPFSCRWFSSLLLRFQAHVPIIGIDVWEHVSHISFLFPFLHAFTSIHPWPSTYRRVNGS